MCCVRHCVRIKGRGHVDVGLEVVRVCSESNQDRRQFTTCHIETLDPLQTLKGRLAYNNGVMFECMQAKVRMLK